MPDVQKQKDYHKMLGNFIFLSPTVAEKGSGQAMVAVDSVVLWQVVLHITFVLSALFLAITDRISTQTASESRAKH